MNKSIFLPTLVFILMASCSVKEEMASFTSSDYYFANSVTKGGIATDSYCVTPGMIMEYIKTTSKDSLSIVSVLPYPTEDNPAFYVVNFENGFKVFPSDSRFGLELISGETDNLDLSVKTKNRGFNIWIEELQSQILAAKDNVSADPTVDYSSIWNSFKNSSLDANQLESLSHEVRNRDYLPPDMLWAKIKISNSVSTTVMTDIGHLLQTKWGQGNPWNVSLPDVGGDRWITGCVAVAVAQILYYFNQSLDLPSGLYHSLDVVSTPLSPLSYYGPNYYNVNLNRSNFVFNSSRWGSMPLDSLSGTTTGYRYVSDLMLDVGQRLGMHYSSSLSVVTADSNGFINIAPCKLSYSWSSFSDTYGIRNVLYSLKYHDSPVIVSATINNTSLGHTWVIDGFRATKVTTFEKYGWYPASIIPPQITVYDTKTTSELIALYGEFYGGMQVEENHHTSIENYYKMNWGYDGEHDDYLYLVGVNASWDGFNTNKVIHYDLSPSEFNIP